MASERWQIHFFQRPIENDSEQSVPAVDFLNGVAGRVAAEMQAVLEAVADAPPPSFSGGGKWEAMHGAMKGINEIRVQGDEMNHRLFCLLERNAHDLGGPSIVVLGGLSKPKRSAANPKEYSRIVTSRDEFTEHRTVLK